MKLNTITDITESPLTTTTADFNPIVDTDEQQQQQQRRQQQQEQQQQQQQQQPQNDIIDTNPDDSNSISELFADFDHEIDGDPIEHRRRKNSMLNFVLMSTLFSINQACVVSCLILAPAKFGITGCYQSGTYYLSYTISAIIFGSMMSPTTIKDGLLKPRNATMMGTALNGVYVSSFFVVATNVVYPTYVRSTLILGAIVGGIGTALSWAGQRVFFARACAEYAVATTTTTGDATLTLAVVFTFLSVTMEILLKLVSSIDVVFDGGVVVVDWTRVYAIYLCAALVASLLMPCLVRDCCDGDDEQSGYNTSKRADGGNAGWKMVKDGFVFFWKDSKMKYAIGMSLIASISDVFIDTYISAIVVYTRLPNGTSNIGILSSIASLFTIFKIPLLLYLKPNFIGSFAIIIGSLSFFMMGFMFYVINMTDWHWPNVAGMYIFYGIGKVASREAVPALVVLFDDMEAPFVDFILQNRIMCGILYFVAYHIPWETFQWALMICAILSIFGYWRVMYLFRREAGGRSISVPGGEDRSRNNDDDASEEQEVQALRGTYS